MKILKKEELLSAEWQERSRQSVEVLKAQKDGEAAETQEALLNFIINLGGVRQEVYEYLLTPRFADTNAVVSVRTLLCYAAPMEWMALAVRALKKDAIAGVMFVQEITTAYKEGITLEKAEELLEKSDTAFEMCQNRISYEKGICDRMTGSEADATSELHGRVTGSEADATSELHDRMTGSEDMMNNMADMLKHAVSEAVREVMIEMKHDALELHDRMTGSEETGEEGLYDKVTGSEDDEIPELHDRMAGSGETGEEELYGRVTGSGETGEEGLYDKVTGSGDDEIPELHDRMMGSGEAGEEELYDRVTGSEETYSLIQELEEKEKAMEGRVSFFHILLNRHMKKMFSKMDDKSQLSKIFEIMVQKKYNKGKIVAIKKLLDGGMQREFIFSLLEKDLSEEELQDLCDTLLESREV